MSPNKMSRFVFLFTNRLTSIIASRGRQPLRYLYLFVVSEGSAEGSEIYNGVTLIDG